MSTWGGISEIRCPDVLRLKALERCKDTRTIAAIKGNREQFFWDKE